MVGIDTFRQFALSFLETKEVPHVKITSFKVANKVFATLNAAENRATIILSAVDQDVFCLFDKNVLYPVPNRWGKMGWTHINLKTVSEELCVEALKTAYCEIAPKRLSSLITFE